MKTPLLSALFVGAAAMLFTSLSPVPAQADSAAVGTCLDEMVQGAAAQGRRLRATDADSTAAKEAVDYRLTLYKGMTYVLIGCAEDGVDLDIRLYDSNGNLVDKDGAEDNKPFVFVEPPATGEYVMQVLVYKTDKPTNDFAVAITYQY
jgi:hypothetical protein